LKKRNFFFFPFIYLLFVYYLFIIICQRLSFKYIFIFFRTQIANNPCDAEALHELIRIFASSQERKDIENFLKISPSNDLDSDSESESEGSDHEETLSAHISKKMKIPSLSQSPALIHCEHNQMSLVEESTNDFEFVFGEILQISIQISKFN